ncbi:MAG: DNA polymerase IV, partial [Desulfuromonadales bacterium]|nr:DNA polymerase IV [Desulfuromonadales bacterium]NIR33928.1 DNA polymerase IV [Desulfuromonadales bacterium]NIS43920.1 DNA polymerase IV [Desulfuromonadales bacterium]
MDAFFAAVEKRRRPDLADKPVIVGGRGDPSERAVVSAGSYEARRFGVHSGMPLRQARQLCPKAVFLPVDLPAYRRVSLRIKALLRELSPVIEDLGIDEACLDITHLQEPPERIGR